MGLKEDVLNMRKEVNEIKEQSDLIRVMEIDDRKNKRLCRIIALLTILLVISLCYIIYLYNDIGTEEITTATSQEVSDVDSIDNSYIINGDNYGKDKTN